MFHLLYILISFLQVSSGNPLTSEESGSVALSAATSDHRAEQPDFSVREVTLDQLRKYISENPYVPVPSDSLQLLSRLWKQPQVPAGVSNPPRIREVRFEARLNERHLVDGKLELDIPAQRTDQEPRPLLLGPTNLQHLAIFDGDAALAIGADRERRLFVLNPGTSEMLRGTWSTAGAVTGDFVTFRMELPPAITSQFRLVTPLQVQVSSSNALVLGPQPADDGLVWMIFPNVASRLTLTCRTRRLATAESAFSLAGLTTVHTVIGDSLASRWTISLPSELQGRNVLTVDLPISARLVDVLLNDNQPVEWTSSQHNDVQQLRMVLSGSQTPSAISVLATSVWTQSDQLPLPIMTPRTWERLGSGITGPILLPVSQISLTVPPGIDLDGWSLRGIQERDVIAGPDNSRTFQLIRFGNNAAATAHISTSVARIISTLITVLEASGRLATARCYVNVRCEESAVVELAWPVSRGWDVIAARDTSSGRSLFFEFASPGQDQTTSRLLVHLPESLEPQTSQVFEIQLQQSDWPEEQQTQLPIRLPDVTGERQPELLVLNPSAQQSISASRLWNNRRPVLPHSQFTVQHPWFPSGILISDSIICDVSGESDHQGNPLEPMNPEPERLLNTAETSARRAILSYTAIVEKNQLHQFTQIVIPARSITNNSVKMQVIGDQQQFAAGSTILDTPERITWTVNNTDVDAVLLATDNQESGIQRWSIPVPGSLDPDSDVVIMCEQYRAVTDRFSALLPFPEDGYEFRGQIELAHSGSLVMNVDGLSELSPSLVSRPRDGIQSRYFRIPESAQRLEVQLEPIPATPPDHAIDANVFHLIRDDDTLIIHEVMAIARVSRPGGRTSMPLELPAAVEPIAFVDGSRVQLIVSDGAMSVPFPETQQECEVVLIWSQRLPKSSLMTTQMPLSAVFRPVQFSELCTHHLLAAPELELLSPGASWLATVRIDAISMLRQTTADSADLLAVPSSRSIAASAATRGFITLWQLSSSLGWNHRTLAITAADGTAIRIQVNSVVVRRTLQYSAILVSLTACCVLLPLTARYRVSLAVLIMLLAISRLLIPSAAMDAVICGIFWGLTAGVILSFVVRWPQRKPRPTTAAVTTAVFLLFVLNPAAAYAQERRLESISDIPGADANNTPEVSRRRASESTLPDLLILKNGIPGSQLAYLHPLLFEKWKVLQQQELQQNPQVVVISQQIRIIADAAASVEAVLSMQVAVIASERQTSLTLPLQDARLVACSVDDLETLPRASDNDAILIPLPASILVPPRKLPALSSNRENEASEQMEAFSAAEAGPPETWNLHRIECRLRPQITRHANGMQFRLPVLPCPTASVTVESPPSLVRRAFVRTGSGVLQWSPGDESLVLNSVQLTEGLDVRLFSGASEENALGQPNVQLLVICEMSAGQQLLTCVCHCTQWNPLVQNAQISIPEGYRLMAVSSAQAGELFWSVRDGTADIQLNDLSAGEFFLELKLLCEFPTEPQEQQISIAKLGQIQGVLRSATAFTAVRTTPEFTVQQPAAGIVTNLTSADIPPGFTGWLRRADSLYQVPAAAQDITFRLLPRTSYSEVRVAQTVECGESWIDWTYTADIETAVLGRFRHQMIVDPEIEITDVQVFAGEANRLDKRYRRGDRLMILLKEGTTGLYRLTIRGRQNVIAADAEVRLRCPQFQEIPILESSLTIIDRSEAGYLLADTGTAVPDRRLQPDQILTQGTPLRLQIVDETEPVILRRRRLSSRDASLAIIRHPDRAIVLLQVESFPVTVEMGSMSFASDVVFLDPPRVLLNGDVRNSVRIGNDFRWTVPGELTEDITLTASWVVPLPSTKLSTAPLENAISLPTFSFDLRWKQTVMADGSTAERSDIVSDRSAADSVLAIDELADITANSAEAPTRRDSDIPLWISNALEAFEVENIPADVRFYPVEISESLSSKNALLPIAAPLARSETSGNLKPLIVADTVMLVTPHQSAVAETTLVVFAEQPGTRLTLQIPRQSVVTRIHSEHPVRRDPLAPNQLIIDLADNITLIRLRWLSQRATGTMFQTRLQITPPVPMGVAAHHLITMYSMDPGASHITTTALHMEETPFQKKLQACLLEGLQQLSADRTAVSSMTETDVPETARESLTDNSDLFGDSQLREERALKIEQNLNQYRDDFLASSSVHHSFTYSPDSANSNSLWRIYSSQSGDLDEQHSVSIAIRRVPSLSTLLPYMVAVAIMVMALAGRGGPSQHDPGSSLTNLQDGVDASAATWPNAPGLSVSAADVLALSDPVSPPLPKFGTDLNRTSTTAIGKEGSASGNSST